MLQSRITVWENLIVYALLYRVNKPEQKIRDLCSYFSITHLLDQRFRNLSSGERTRVTWSRHC
jgi:ABC-type multidrug transport system ATPase subunit